MDSTVAEFDLIERIRRRVATRDDVLLGIGDDAALLQPPAGMQLVVAMDTLNSGVHFPPDTAPADIGWKALAVNLSDLAAMGALPAWCTLSLSLPDADGEFVDGFLDGFLALASQHDLALVGGDTTRGPLSICVAVHGFIEPGQALRRDGARAGDDLWVSGTLGDAAAALSYWQSGGAIDPTLRMRLDRPTPRVSLGHVLRGIATSCIDVSDGLLGDLAHILERSHVGAVLDAPSLPLAALLATGAPPGSARHCLLSGGDDYELLFTAAPGARATLGALGARLGVALHRIGFITAQAGEIMLHEADGQRVSLAAAGYDHFARKPAPS